MWVGFGAHCKSVLCRSIGLSVAEMMLKLGCNFFLQLEASCLQLSFFVCSYVSELFLLTAGSFQKSTPNMSRRRFHCTTEAIPLRPWKAKSLEILVSRPIKISIKMVREGCTRGTTRYFFHSCPLCGTLVVQSYQFSNKSHCTYLLVIQRITWEIVLEVFLGKSHFSCIKERIRNYSLRAKGTLICEHRFSTPCEMRFFPREKEKTAFSKKNPRQRPFSLSRVRKIASRRG